jgi:UDP-2-acetamido-3-amino-2,3-dideoxy-glucuronate N-acetyltransferase
MNSNIHETAIVDDGAQIGSNCRIWQWTHVCAGSKIGSNVSLGQNVFVGNKAVIGNKCKIQNNVSIFDNVQLEDEVFCGPSVVFTNVKNPRSLVNRKDEYESTLIKKGATLGANSTIICGTTIGEYAFIGAGAVVNKNVPAFALMVGIPAKQTGWMSKYGMRLNLPKTGNAQTVCIYTGQKYNLKDGILYSEANNENF